MSIRDAAIAIPTYDIDKIIEIIDGTAGFVDSVSVKGTSWGTVVGTATFPVGVYSYDGGTTWLTFGDEFGGFTTKPPIQANIYSTNDYDVEISVNQNAQVNGGSPWTLLFKAALLAREDQEILVDDAFSPWLFSGDFPEPSGVSGFTYSNKYSYMKIAKQGTQVHINGSGYQTYTIPHNLGYVPVFNVWTTRVTNPNHIGRLYNFNVNTNRGAYADATNIYIAWTNAGQDTTIYYRIYHEVE